MKDEYKSNLKNQISKTQIKYQIFKFLILRCPALIIFTIVIAGSHRILRDPARGGGRHGGDKFEI